MIDSVVISAPETTNPVVFTYLSGCSFEGGGQGAVGQGFKTPIATFGTFTVQGPSFVETLTISPLTTTPEPSSLLLLCTGLIGAFRGRAKKLSKAPKRVLNLFR